MLDVVHQVLQKIRGGARTTAYKHTLPDQRSPYEGGGNLIVCPEAALFKGNACKVFAVEAADDARQVTFIEKESLKNKELEFSVLVFSEQIIEEIDPFLSEIQCSGWPENDVSKRDAKWKLVPSHQGVHALFVVQFFLRH